jgi:hypothetical protein
VLEYSSDVLDRGLAACLVELEQALFKLAEQSRNNDEQKRCLDALHEVKRSRADLTPRFLLGFEAALAMLKDEPVVAPPAATGPTARNEMSLVENVVLDETVALREIASRAEVRNSLPLFLLGQRFAVIAGRPALDAEALPVGPHILCRILRESSTCMDLAPEYRQLLFRLFDRHLLHHIGELYEALNTYLIRQRVLPNMTHVPVRSQPAARKRQEPEADGKASGPKRGRPAPDASATGDRVPNGGARGSAGGGYHDAAAGTAMGHGPSGATPASAPNQTGASQFASSQPAGSGSYPGPRPLTAWPGTPEAQAQAQPQTADAGAGNDAGATQDTEMFDVLRQLLAGRRSLLGKLGGEKQQGKSAQPGYVVSPDQVQTVLGDLQAKSAKPVVVEGTSVPRSITHVKQDLLAHQRQVTPEGQAPALAEEHGDTNDLVGMLFDHILKDVRLRRYRPPWRAG